VKKFPISMPSLFDGVYASSLAELWQNVAEWRDGSGWV